MSLPRLLPICAAFFLVVCVGAAATAQSSRRAPPPEVVPIATKDGVQLKLTYFPGAERKGTAEAKQVTPVVLLHDFKGTRTTFNSLARQLQTPVENRPSFAAITVDLRAHGESTKQLLPTGQAIDLDASKFRRDDYLAMVALDMEAVRSFLIVKNDAGELNLNKLCLVGAGMGASIAANWAARDWSAPPLAIGKQGQDVKALVLISPRWSFNGLSFQAPMRFRPLKQNVAWMLLYGEQDAKVRADVARIEKQLERFHPDAGDAAGRGISDLQVMGVPSKLQSDTLLRQLGTPIEQRIVSFLVGQVADTQYPWSSRLSRLP